MSYDPHPSRAFANAVLASKYFDEAHSIQYGLGVRKGSQWFVFFDPSKRMTMPIGIHPDFSDKHSTFARKYTFGEPELVSSSGLNKLGNKGQHPKYGEAFGMVWDFGSAGRFIDFVRDLEIAGALK